MLLQEGADIYAYDPVAAANFEKVYASGKHGRGTITYVEDCKTALQDADICFVFTEWTEIKALSPEHIIKYFSYSLLEIFDTKTKREDIVAREEHWKRVFQTVNFGMNNVGKSK